MADPARAKKLADRIKVLVAEQLEYRVKDPRLGFVTITDVRVTGDLQHASVFYTVLGGEEERSASAAALESARGKLRSAVGQAIGIRLTPTLEFIADALPESAAHLEDLLRTAKERDAAVAAVANGAAFAGEPDPYKRPVEDEDLALDDVPDHQRPNPDPDDELDDDRPPTPAGPPELLSTEAGPARADGGGPSGA